MPNMLPSGTKAPDFSLMSDRVHPVRLSHYRGRIVVLAFYPADWSPVCSSELSLFQEMLEEIRGYNAEVLGVSVDSHFSHRAWAEQRHLEFPLLSDFWPHGAVCRAYGVFREHDGISERALYFVNEAGVIASSWLAKDPAIAPGINVVFKGLERIRGTQPIEEARHV